MLFRSGNGKTETRLVVYKDDDFDWVFATSMKFRDASNMIKLYKKRWNIETGFRVCDEARVKTKSMRIVVRYFLFLCGIVLYDLWKEIYPQITFKKLIQLLAEEHARDVWHREGFAGGYLAAIEDLNSQRNGFASFCAGFCINGECLHNRLSYSCLDNGLAPVVC